VLGIVEVNSDSSSDAYDSKDELHALSDTEDTQELCPWCGIVYAGVGYTESNCPTWSSSTEVSTSTSASTAESNIQAIIMTTQAEEQENRRIFLDNCASKSVIIITERELLCDVRMQTHTINLTGRGASITTQSKGGCGAWKDIILCEQSVKSICSVSRLKKAGFGLVQLQEDWVVNLDTGERQIECHHHNGIPCIYLTDFMALPDISC
jgi:hypothetical protein